MILAIDVGNTNLVFALVDGSEIKARWRIATDARRTADQYSVWLHQLLELEGYSRADVEGVIIGTVVPRALHNLEVLSEKYFQKSPLIAGQGAAAWPLQLDVVAHRLENEYQARARMAPSSYRLARWVTAAEPAGYWARWALAPSMVTPGVGLSLARRWESTADGSAPPASWRWRASSRAPEGRSEH